MGMAKIFDATLNTLIDANLADWAGFLGARCGVPPGAVTALDTDLSATLQADRLFRVEGPTPVAIHLELESNGRLGMPSELLTYNVAARTAISLPVHSVLVLLRPKANATDLSGLLELHGADGNPYLTFRYTVIRVWQESVAGLLDAGFGLSPLALLTNEAANDPPAAFGRFGERLPPVGSPDNLRHRVLSAAYFLGGLRYDGDLVENLLQEFNMNLEDSTTYQLVLNRGRTRGRQEGREEGRLEGREEGIEEGREEGRLAAAQAIVLRLGARRFGSPSPVIESSIRQIVDHARLERIIDRVQDATGWDDLLATS